MTCSCKRKAMNAVEDTDIISDLPRNIIDRILEHLPIRDGARTSVLSRTWRYIWATHPQLILDNQFCKESIENKPYFPCNFVSIINKIFLLHSGPILKFSLYIPSSIHIDQNPDIDLWILILSRNGIMELTFDSASAYPYKLPSYIFSCPQLTRLKLCNCIIKPPHAFKCFRNLISLTFDRIRFATNILGTLFSSAPLLEILVFVSCIGIDHFNIHAPALKMLCVMQIREFKSISLRNSPNLTVLTILPYFEFDNPEWGKTTNLIELVAGLPRIVRLTLDNFVLKVLAAGTVSKRLTAANNSKSIHLWNIDFNDLDQILCILCLLESSTNLQELNIWGDRFVGTGTVTQPVFNFLNEPYWMDLKVNTLGTVKLTLYKCLMAELFFIEFLLARCIVLEKMIIQISRAWFVANEGFKILKELMRFSRASQKAEIIFV